MRQYIFGAHVKVVFVSRTLGGNIIVYIIFQEELQQPLLKANIKYEEAVFLLLTEKKKKFEHG